MAAPSRTVRVGFLHLGPREHGVNRYGRIVAQALRAVPGVAVNEYDTKFTGSLREALWAPVRAVRALRGCDVVLVSYCTAALWVEGPARIWQLLVLHLGLRRRTVAVLHDVYSPGGRRRPEWWALALNLLLPRARVVHGEHDRRVLAPMPGGAGAVAIPHFIEPRRTVERDRARDSLGLDPGQHVVSMVGWIHPRKNYELAVEALARLGPEYRLWLIGDAPAAGPEYLERVRQLVSERGVGDRVTFTGYVDEAEMDARLAATDVGVCAYHDASASSSMSTLLAARRPVIASDIPFARDLERVAPRAMRITAGPEADALAAAITAIVEDPPADADFAAILEARSTRAIAERYAEVLTRAAG